MITEIIELSQEVIDEFDHKCDLFNELIGGSCTEPAKFYAKLHLDVHNKINCHERWAYICMHCKFLLDVYDTCEHCNVSSFKTDIMPI
jgi:hypothetical protein